MKRISNISGAVLPTVMVVSVLLLLTVLAVASLWESDFLFFSRHRHDAMQRAHIESGFTLYREYPENVMQSLDADSTLLLYDSVGHSRINIRRKQWGLYEVVSISGPDGKIHSSKILGKRSAYKNDLVFYYRNNNSALTLTGKTHLKGHVHMPRSGVIYGQMGSVFFNGEKMAADMIKASEKELPLPEKTATQNVHDLQSLINKEYEYVYVDSIRHEFSIGEALVLSSRERLEHCKLSGNIIIVGKNIEIDTSCRTEDILVIAQNIRIREGFRGSLQAFASDSLNIENNVTLEYPSGLFSATYIGIGDETEVNGYVIVHPDGEPDIRNANYEQSRLSTVRGLVYVSGTAQFQGIVSGAVFLDKAVYYSPRGYYENMIYDATILPNTEMAWPMWLHGPQERKEVKWVY